MARDDSSGLPTPVPMVPDDDSDVRAAFADLDRAASDARASRVAVGNQTAPAGRPRPAGSRQVRAAATLPPQADDSDFSVGDLFDDRPKTDANARAVRRIAPPPRRLESGGIDPAFESLFGQHGPAQPSPLALDLDEVERAARFIDDFCGDDIGTTGTRHEPLASDPHEAPTVIPGIRRATADQGVVYDDTLPAPADEVAALEEASDDAGADANPDDELSPGLRALLQSFVNSDGDSAPSGF